MKEALLDWKRRRWGGQAPVGGKAPVGWKSLMGWLKSGNRASGVENHQWSGKGTVGADFSHSQTQNPCKNVLMFLIIFGLYAVHKEMGIFMLTGFWYALEVATFTVIFDAFLVLAASDVSAHSTWTNKALHISSRKPLVLKKNKTMPFIQNQPHLQYGKRKGRHFLLSRRLNAKWRFTCAI